MRWSRMERFLTRHWYTPRLSPVLYPLVPLAGLFGAASLIRQAMAELRLSRAFRPSVPVLVVGNLVAGGTGKTPLVIWLAGQFRERGVEVGVVSRGHGGRLSGPARVPLQGSAREFGDEPVLIARRTGSPVVIGHNRARAARWLLEHESVDLIISDDGLQHYGLARDVEWITVDGSRGWGNRWLLPAGPLRERVRRAGQVDAVWVKAPVAGSPIGHPFRLIADRAVRLCDQESRPLAHFAGQSVHAVSGIGNPDSFFDLLAAHDLVVLPHPLADHKHLPSRRLLEWRPEAPILLTEKDAVKYVPEECSDRLWSVPVEVTVDEPSCLQAIDELAARVRSWNL